MSNKADWLAIVGAVLLFLALIGLIIVFRRSRTVILPTSRKWEIHRQVQGEKEVRKQFQKVLSRKESEVKKNEKVTTSIVRLYPHGSDSLAGWSCHSWKGI